MAIDEFTVEDTYRVMCARLHGIVPEIELRYKAELAYEVNRLKAERVAVILGHNYMEPALYYSVPDFVGDSLELARRASETDASVIVFCGVRFMAETAKILCPDKTVLVPSPEAGCSLAAGITADDVRMLKRRFPGAPVVTYVNTYADVKAESDACCTSSNAAEVVLSFDAPAVIFLPDEYLARNVARETGKRIIITGPDGDGSGGAGGAEAAMLDNVIIGWNSRCEVHEKFTVDDVRRVRKQFPDVLVLAHPECRPDVTLAADFAGSTSAMIRRVRQSDARRYLLLTECSMGDNIAAENPDKEMLRLCSVRCPHMNEISLEQTLEALRRLRYEVHVPAEIADRARPAIDRMLAIRPRQAAKVDKPACRN